MSRGPAVEVQGLRTLRAELKRAGLSLQDLKDVHADIARMVVTQATFRPKHPDRSTGRLAASARGAGTQRSAIVRAGGAALPYGNPVHWGWPSRHIVAQPWLWDAAVDSREQWTGMYLSELETIIAKIEGAPGP